MTITLVFDVALVALLLFRQRRVRRVARHLRLFGPVVLGLIGLYQLSAFTDHHRLTGAVTTALLGAIVVGAVALGAARGATVALWRLEGVVLRQATWLTMGLWAVSLALYAAVAGWIGSLDAVAGVAWSASAGLRRPDPGDPSGRRAPAGPLAAAGGGALRHRPRARDHHRPLVGRRLG